ncbi:MAG: phosphopantetheine-binding protein [Myxococcota bacterium]|jgi:acyl carrier protein
MDNQEALAKVTAIIKPFAKNQGPLAAGQLDARILEDLGVNSARLVDIILAFEDEFGISIDDDTADSVRTIGDAVRVVSAQ